MLVVVVLLVAFSSPSLMAGKPGKEAIEEFFLLSLIFGEFGGDSLGVGEAVESSELVLLEMDWGKIKEGSLLFLESFGDLLELVDSSRSSLSGCLEEEEEEEKVGSDDFLVCPFPLSRVFFLWVFLH